MIAIKASEVKERFEEYVIKAHHNPVHVDDSNGGVVILSQADYDRLQSIEDAVWAQRANEASKRGFASQEAVQGLLDRLERAERGEEISPTSD